MLQTNNAYRKTLLNWYEVEQFENLLLGFMCLKRRQVQLITLRGDTDGFANGLMTKIQDPKFLFIAHNLHAMLDLLQVSNRLLQAEIWH